MALAQAALDSGEADEVLFVLPGVLPHKTYDGVGLEQRLELVSAATAEEPRFSVAVTERGLFHEIAGECRIEYAPGVEIAILCGRDAAERIVGWDYGSGPPIEEQLAGFGLLVAPRGGPYVAPAPLRSRIRHLPIAVELEEISATEVRERVRRREAWRHLVPDSIAGAVERLYGSDSWR